MFLPSKPRRIYSNYASKSVRIHWSDKALAQLADITEGIRSYSEAAAERTENDLLAAASRLGEFPQLGRIVPESKLAIVRELFVGKYRLVYTLSDFQVEIVAVLHQA
ncbi:MAG: type II toxin-antitoxin system RelE/ParE family toxin [Hymenobacter sp.]|nr:MAG: type II toxin-antitoxin system RelE/ParE family toxin [Hymenobacter sp.]